MPNHAATVASSSSGTQTSAALLRVIVEPSGWVTPWTPRKVKSGRKMTAGATICITLTPRLPRPPLTPSALPCFAFGKKKLIFPMLEAKFAPAKPHNNAIIINTQNGVVIFWIATPNQIQGTIRITVLNTVQ